ncbi:MAG: ABC transporter substrate-binding protein [Chloroflexi bacterium]|nr:ABC transporter substrate-binding protein [Chloroflexota bacterium]
MFDSNYWQRRFGRRAALRGAGVAGVGIAGAALIGCGGGEEAAPAKTGAAAPAKATQVAAAKGAGEQPQTGGTFTVATGAEPRSLDPHFDVFIPLRMTYNTLTRFSQDLSQLEPELAEKLPEVPDANTYIFKLRKGVKFHNVAPANGREFTSADVKYSINRQITDEPGKYQHAYYFKDKVVDIQTPDAHTVIFKTGKPFAPFQNYVASPWTLMVNRETVEKHGDLTQVAVGTGPFVFEQWQKEVQIKWRKNPDYFVPGQPYVDNVVLLMVKEPDTQATMYIDRKLDAVAVGQSQLKRVQDARSKDSQYQAVPSQFWRVFRLMPTQKDKPYKKPFDDVRVREAVVRGIDKKAGLDLIYNGDGQLALGPILSQFTNWALKEELAGFDPKKSADLFAAAGKPEVKGPMVWASTGPEPDQVAEVIKQQLTKIGVQVELKPMELAAYYNLIYQYDYTFSHHVPLNSPDPDENLAAYFGKNATYFKHYNPEIFDLVDKQAATVDFKERQKVVLDVQRKIVLDFPQRFMWTTNVHQFLDNRVKGWWFSLDRYENYWAPLWMSKKA